MRQLVVDPGPFAWTLGLFEGGGLRAVRVLERIDGIEEGLFLARLTRLAPDLGGAFVDAGGIDLLVRLPAKLRRGRLAEGTKLLVYGVRDAVQDKPPRGSLRWRVPGRFLDLRSDDGEPDLDESVQPAQRQPLAQRARTLLPGRPALLKPTAEHATDDALLAEADRLARRRERWMTRAAERDASGPLATFEDRLAAILAGFDLGPQTKVITRRTHRLDVARRLATAWESDTSEAIEGADDPWEAAGVGEAWTLAHQPELALLGGGRLTIEPTRALIAIDVDRGGRTGPSTAVNDAAVDALAMTIATRQLGGQIVVDFLDPGGPAGRKALQRRLETTLADTNTHVVTVLGSGLAVLERPRRTAALHERKNTLREAATALLDEAVAAPLARWRLAPDLDGFLRHPRTRALAENWLAASGVTLNATSDPNLPPAHFAPA